MKIPHIPISKNDRGHVTVKVEDTELFDYVEDHLIEQHDIEYEHVNCSEENGLKIYTIHFPKDVTSVSIEQTLGELSHIEIQRIFRLNNPQKEQVS